MSYEGYDQILCENGHLLVEGAYFSNAGEWTCPICGKPEAWRNQVNETNGSFDEDGNRIDGYIELEMEKEPVSCRCDKCGNVHDVAPARYKMPSDGWDGQKGGVGGTQHASTKA